MVAGLTGIVSNRQVIAAGPCTTISPIGNGRVDPQVTPSGRYVVYGGPASQLYRFDRQTNTTTLVSTGGTTEGNGASRSAAVSADGRFVAFVSSASNLVAGDTNEKPDVFVRDVVQSTTERVSVTADGSQASAFTNFVGAEELDFDRPAISNDGRFVAFVSADPALATENMGYANVFVRDRQTATTTRESLAPVAPPSAANGSYQPSLSGNGRYIAFAARSNAYGDEAQHVIVRDRQENSFVKVTGTEGNRGGRLPHLTADGTQVAYQRLNASSNPEIVVVNLATKAIEVVSAGITVFPFVAPTISPDGSAVAFASNHTDESNATVQTAVMRDRQASKFFLAAYDLGTSQISLTDNGDLLAYRTASNFSDPTIALSPTRVPRLRRTFSDGLKQNRVHAIVPVEGWNLDTATLDFGPGITLNSLTEHSFGLWKADVDTTPTAHTDPRTLTATKDGCAATATNTFNVAPASTITSVSPATVGRRVTKTFQLEGTGFGSGVAKAGPGINVTESTLTDATHASFTATITTAAAAGPRDVEWHNADGTVGVCDDCLTVDAVAPTIAYVGPSDKSLAAIVVVLEDADTDEARTEISVTRGGVPVSLTRSTPEPNAILLTLTTPVDGDYAVAIKAHDDAGNVGPETVRVAQRGEHVVDLNAYGPFQGGAYTTAGDVNGDGVDELITAAAAGGGPHVRVFAVDALNKASTEVAGWMAYGESFFGGVRVAAADVDGDGTDEVVTGPGPGGGPHVRVWHVNENKTVSEVSSFMAYDAGFTGGVYLAGGDTDGFANLGGVKQEEVVVTPDAGGGPHVRTFTRHGDGLLRASDAFMAYDPKFFGGVRVAAADLDGDGIVEVLTGAGKGGGPHVQAFDVHASESVASFFAYDPKFLGGVFVSSADVDGDTVDEVLVGAGGGGGPHIRVLSLEGGDEFTELAGFYAYDAGFAGGVSSAGGDIDGDGDDDVVTTPGPGMQVTARARRIV